MATFALIRELKNMAHDFEANLCAVTRTNRIDIESRKVRVAALQFSEQKTF